MGLVRNLTDGRSIITDGTLSKTNVGPGDFSTENANPVEVYLDHGEVITDGSGARMADQDLAQGTVSFYISDYTDGDNVYSLLKWWGGAASSAITTAGWASTTTRDDSKRTLHVQWHPDGVGSGNAYESLPDCILVAVTKAQGRPNAHQITVRSTTAHEPAYAVTP
jgi:hypothetical protein